MKKVKFEEEKLRKKKKDKIQELTPKFIEFEPKKKKRKFKKNEVVPY